MRSTQERMAGGNSPRFCDRPVDWLAEARDLTLHIDVNIDVNVCRRAGSEPIAFMRRYPGRTDSLLLTDGPAGADRHAPLFGKGDSPWKESSKRPKAPEVCDSIS